MGGCRFEVRTSHYEMASGPLCIARKHRRTRRKTAHTDSAGAKVSSMSLSLVFWARKCPFPLPTAYDKLESLRPCPQWVDPNHWRNTRADFTRSPRVWETLARGKTSRTALERGPSGVCCGTANCTPRFWRMKPWGKALFLKKWPESPEAITCVILIGLEIIATALDGRIVTRALAAHPPGCSVSSTAPFRKSKLR